MDNHTAIFTKRSGHGQEGYLIYDCAPPDWTIVGQPGSFPHNAVHPRLLHDTSQTRQTRDLNRNKSKQYRQAGKENNINLQKPSIFTFFAVSFVLRCNHLNPSLSSHLPPSLSIRSFSLGSSGLWSCVISSAWSLMSESFSFTPTTTAESPTCATYM